MLDISQILALAIFIALFIAIIIGKIHRYIPAIIAGVLMLAVFVIVMKKPEAAVNVLNLGQIIHLNFWVPGHEHLEANGVNWQTIVFIGGMMAMVESMGDVGFFDWLCLSIAKLVKFRPVPIFISFMLVSGILSMFIDSITVLLFMTAIAIELARLLKIDPVPFIIAMIFAANTGGSATMSGDPPNIIIGTSLGFTFTDFLANTGVIAGVGLIAALGFFLLVFRKALVPTVSQNNLAKPYPDPGQAITNPFLFKINIVIFIFIVILLISHANTGLSVASIGVIAAILTLVVAWKRAFHIMKRVDWRTLTVFCRSVYHRKRS